MQNRCRLVLLGSLILSTFLVAQPVATVQAQSKTEKSKTPTKLPKEWHGTWQGQMTITNPAGRQQKVKVVFLIEPVADQDELIWKMTFGEAAKQLVKDYKLAPVDKKPGHFWIVEPQLKLRSRLVGDVLYSQFSLGKTLLNARYEMRGKSLRFEVVSSSVAKSDKKDSVQQYEVNVVQFVELIKVD